MGGSERHPHALVALEAGIVSDDPAVLGRFLVDGLGFTADGVRRFPQGEVHRFRRDDARCKVFAPADGVRARAGEEPWAHRSGFAYAALLVDDAESSLAQAVAAGATMVAELTSHRPGARMAMVRDPQGNVWELLEEKPPSDPG